MSKTAWIVVGSIVGVGGLATAGYFIWRSTRKTEVDEVFEQETQERKEELGVADGAASNPFLGDLIEKIWVMDNTSKYASLPSGNPERDSFMERSRNLNRALQHKGLTYWRDDKTHNLEKGGTTVVSLPRA